MNNGPIIIVDDDPDDFDILQTAWKETTINNELIHFEMAHEVLEYLRSDQPTPFLIICDVNLPQTDAFELKEEILKDSTSNYKSIPFVFWSSSASDAQIQKAYDLGGNGFFIKDNNFNDMKQSLLDIVNYWKKSKTPE